MFCKPCPRAKPARLAPTPRERYDHARFHPLSREFVIPRTRTNQRLQVLTRREARVVRALAETIFPADGQDMPSVDEAGVVEYLDDLLSHLELKERLLIRSLLALLETQSLAFNGLRPKLFSHASPEERFTNLAGWEKSRFFQRRMVFMAIRTLLLWAYVDSSEAERDMGFSPGTHATARRNRARAAAAAALSQVKSGAASDSELRHA